ncbi:MAG: hypothetical protein M3Q44_00845 [bacterium]|nr:hypothetical protein [bacterium]
MSYLHDEQDYIDRYDLHTIEECLDYYKAVRKGFEEHRDKDEFKKYTKKSFTQEVQKVLNLMTNTLMGEQYRNKAKTIQEWMDRDRKEQEKYDNATPPPAVPCKECNAPIKVANKDLLHSYEEHAQVLFMFRCTKCNKGQAFYEDGTEWIYDPPKCPKCSAPLKSDHKDVNEVMTTTWSCTKCSYTKEDVYDFKKSRLEREKEEAKDKKLLADYREIFCLPEKEGQEYIELREAMEVGHEVYEEELRKYADPVYEVATQLKKLNINELEKLLTEILEKNKFIKLSFEKPEMGLQVIVPFTVQDADSSRKDNISISDLKKLLKDTLEATNWRLMSDGVNYRLGFVFGRLKGYEGEEAMLELAGKKKEVKPPPVDSEKRAKYSSNNVVQLAKISGEIQGQENIRKKRLEKEPKGFAIPAGGTYTCHICFTSINSENGWYDKHGFKCLDCQRAADNGTLPPEVFEEERSWYTDWHVESEFHIPALTIKKLVKQGILKPRIVTDSAGRDHTHVFLALENNDLLEAYKQKHRIVLLCGVPASGKFTFAKYLQDKHGYTYISLGDDEWADKKLKSLWDDVFEEKRQYNKVETFVRYFYDTYENVVLDWSFPMEQLRVVELLKRQWCEVIWLSCSTAVARKRYIKQHGSDSIHLFDTQVKTIEENTPKLVKNLNPHVIDVLKKDNANKTEKEIYADFASIIDDL